MQKTEKIHYVYANSSTSEALRDGFVKVYQEAFAGPPYYEHYTEDEVIEDVWKPHVGDGIIVLAVNNDEVVGFGCAKPLAKSPNEIQDFAVQKREAEMLPFDLQNTWYMSELGVAAAYRGKKIGYELIKHRLSRISELDGIFYILRTAAEGSNSLHMYRKIGSIELQGTQSVSATDQVVINKSKSSERIYLYGRCTLALRNIVYDL